MNERLFACLAERLALEPVVLASVIATRGATPRKIGARMLIGSQTTDFTIGGGLAEARVIDAARALLDCGRATATVAIDLGGGVDAAGVCGGRMEIALRRWTRDDRLRAATIATTLRGGAAIEVTAAELGGADGAHIEPDPRLLVIGGGHCGFALYEMARLLDFDLWIYDARPAFTDPAIFPDAQVISGEIEQIRAALDTRRALYIVLLNRDYLSDIAALRVIVGQTYAFLGMMGSARRIREVRNALDAHQADQLTTLQAPVGLPIGAQTPHEIAISVLAHLIQARAARHS